MVVARGTDWLEKRNPGHDDPGYPCINAGRQCLAASGLERSDYLISRESGSLPASSAAWNQRGRLPRPVQVWV